MATSVSLHWIAFIDLSEEKPAAKRQQKWPHRCGWYCHAYGIFYWRANISGQEPFSSPTSCLLLAAGLLLLTSEAAARSSSPLLPGFYCATCIMKSYSTNRMPDVVSTSELSPETAGACVDPRKSFEVRPQKICACRDVDEKQVCTAKSWFIYPPLFLFFFFKRNISLLGHF